MSGRSTSVALACSLAAHALVLGAVGLMVRSAGTGQVTDPGQADRWGGETLDLDAILPASQGGLSQAARDEREATSRAVAAAPAAADRAEAMTELRSQAPASAPKPDRRPKARDSQPTAPSARAASTSSAGVGRLSTEPGAGGESPEQGNGSGVAGTSGAVGAGGVRNLAVAFTRAIPIAVSGDPVWATLHIGEVGTLDVRIEVDEAGKIVSAAPARSPVPVHLQALVQRTVAMLRAGRFAITHRDVRAGSQTLRVSVALSMVEGGVGNDDVSAGPYALGFEPPGGGKPGRAYFTLRSGRHVEVTVTVVDG